jgi:hypothetical protein
MSIGRSGIVVIAALVAACSSRHGTSKTMAGSSAVVTEPPVTIHDADGAKAQAGKEIAVAGTARDAKLAAAIVAEGDFIVYCLGVDSWPSSVSGKPIVARGKLEQTDELEGKLSADGAVSAGTYGPVWVLRGCQYDH